MCSFFDYSCGIADTAFAAEVDVTGAVNDRGASTRTVSPEQFGDSPRKARNGRRQLPYRLAHLISRRVGELETFARCYEGECGHTMIQQCQKSAGRLRRCSLNRRRIAKVQMDDV